MATVSRRGVWFALGATAHVDARTAGSPSSRKLRASEQAAQSSATVASGRRRPCSRSCSIPLRSAASSAYRPVTYSSDDPIGRPSRSPPKHAAERRGLWPGAGPQERVTPYRGRRARRPPARRPPGRAAPGGARRRRATGPASLVACHHAGESRCGAACRHRNRRRGW